jgi:ATP-dependent helicase Lhr and Lhr-like helicase
MTPSPGFSFHPAVAQWFSSCFAKPTSIQDRAWPAIQTGKHVLISAPTGSGKTLAAFLAAIDDLVRQGLSRQLKDETQVVYVSPLKALSNDIQRNLEVPLAGIRQVLIERGLQDVEIRTWVRTGDTPPGERERMRRRAPHIVVTTPESLYIMLGSDSGRAMLATTRTVIVDEIHALAPNKRGSHLSLSLERMAALCDSRLVRIGLSATQNPIETVAHFLVGADLACTPEPHQGKPDPHVRLDRSAARKVGGRLDAGRVTTGADHALKAACSIINAGHQRARDLAIEIPSSSPLEAVMSAEVWEQVYLQLAELIESHRTTLIFVNTRRMAERVTRRLSERLGENQVAAHHGSLAKELRLDAEQRLKHGALKALVATTSLELGIDVGDIDLVCQIGSPRSISSFLQRVGRSGHAVDAMPKGRLFPLSRDELVESVALLDSIRRSELDRLRIPEQPLDVLAQQIVAEVAAREWNEDELYALLCRAWPYRALAREDFDAVVRMLAEGFSTRRGRRGALIHYDAVNHVLRGRRGARLTALTAGGTIPDNAEYQVLLEPENQVIGTVNEDFAIESLAGDIFQLGNKSYRILRIERGVVRVEDGHAMPPTIPFWLGEAEGRSNELSHSVSRLRADIATHLQADATGKSALNFLVDEVGVTNQAAEQLLSYLSAAHAALGCLPTQGAVVLERFFDEAGGMQLVIHSPYGSRINRAWGLALRKRFCRKFNFELQAAATEDNIVLSLTTAHSFELGEVPRYLHSASVRTVLIQAMLDAPMFTARWRWVAGVSLALPRFRNGKKVAPQLARMQAEDLIAAVFPDQIACAENLVGEREIPDHPLVRQTIADCLNEAMDIEGLETLLSQLESEEIRVVTCDLTQPSPLALEVLSARPYAFLDDAPLEERRTQAVMRRRWLAPDAATELGHLDTEAIARARTEAWPEATNVDELHDALSWVAFLTVNEARAQTQWSEWLEDLVRDKRATRLHAPGATLWIAAERVPQFQALWPKARLDPAVAAPKPYAGRDWSRDDALVEIVRGRFECSGPITPDVLAGGLGLDPSEITTALTMLESEGFVLRGRFTPTATTDEWCERRLLARIHGYTINRLRKEIEPVPARDFLRFLFAWQRITAETRMEGPDAIDSVVGQLEGFEAPAAAWEAEILPARLAGYEPAWLDDRCLAGRVAWIRLRQRNGRSNDGSGRPTPLRTTPITLLARRHAPLWASLSAAGEPLPPSARAQMVADCIRQHGASFFEELVECTGLLRSQVEEALAELVALGIVSSDSFSGLRALLTPSGERRPIAGARRRRRTVNFGIENAGRWTFARRSAPPRPETTDNAIEHVARTLLVRYGVVFWRLLEREAAWLPPWRDLLRVYHRLESRGEVRGGRFVAGFAGEQFALPETIAILRRVRRQEGSGEWISLSGADPLNLVGILTPGPKLAALTGNRLLYRDGLPVALLSAGEVQFLETLDSASEWDGRKALLRSGTTVRSVPNNPDLRDELLIARDLQRRLERQW